MYCQLHWNNKPKINENDSDSVKNTIQVNSYLPIDLQRISEEQDIHYIHWYRLCIRRRHWELS